MTTATPIHNRTEAEIVARIEEHAEKFFDFTAEDLLPYLSYAKAKPYINAETTEEDWAGIVERNRKPPAEVILDYLPFAWEKANNCRGLSAGRSVNHFETWLWLDGKEELASRLSQVYEYYGKTCLVLVSEEYGFNWLEYDNDKWVNEEDEPSVDWREVLAKHGIESKFS